MAQSLPASKFPECADVYFCDNCGRDVTKYLHPGRAHVRRAVGPVRYVCVCGKTYLTGAMEWDYLSEWEKHQWRADIGLAALLFMLLVVPIGLAYAAWHRHSALLLGILVIVLIPAVVVLRLFALTMLGFVDIARSIWRTRFGSAST